ANRAPFSAAPSATCCVCSVNRNWKVPTSTNRNTGSTIASCISALPPCRRATRLPRLRRGRRAADAAGRQLELLAKVDKELGQVAAQYLESDRGAKHQDQCT